MTIPGHTDRSGDFYFILVLCEQSLGRIEKSVTKYKQNFSERFRINQNCSAMKAKTLISVYLLLGFGINQPFAQNDKNGNGTSTNDYVWDGYYIPVYTSIGEQIDWLVGLVTYHSLYHYKDGIPVWKKEAFKGKLKV